MTLKDLVRDQSATEQLRIFALADVFFGSREKQRGWKHGMALPGQTFPDRGGRFYGGQLTDAQVEYFAKRAPKGQP